MYIHYTHTRRLFLKPSLICLFSLVLWLIYLLNPLRSINNHGSLETKFTLRFEDDELRLPDPDGTLVSGCHRNDNVLTHAK